MCDDNDKDESTPRNVLHGEPDIDPFEENTGLLDNLEDIEEEEWPDSDDL